jgi:DNA-binding Xre family transcriptional regulator
MNRYKIHIGKLIQEYVKKKHIKSADLAREVGKTRQNMYDLYKRDDIEVKLLLTISDALQHDFIDEIRPQSQKISDLDAIFDSLKTLVKENMNSQIELPH